MTNTTLKKLIPVAVLMLTGAAFGAFSVDVWRGETAIVKIPDGVRMSGLKRVKGVEFGFLERKGDVVSPTKNPADYCTIAVSTKAAPGTYDVGPMTLNVSERVLPPPKKWSYFLDLWQHPWAVARYFNVKPFSKEHYKKMLPVWKTLADCGQKTLTVTLLDLPWNHQCYDGYDSMIGRVKKADGTWVFDYKLFDEYVAFGRKCGLGPDIACYTMCPWGYVVRWKDEKGVEQKATAKPGSDVFDDYWGDFLVDFAKHLKKKGWFDDTFIAMDERSPADVKFIVKYIQEKAPGLKVSLAGNRKPSDFAGITLDVYSQALRNDFINDAYLEELKARRAAGHKTTFYVCCFPDKPNTFTTSADDESFWIGAYPALSGFDGFLRWAANSWPKDPYKDASYGKWPAGDTFLVYPNGEMSARLVALRAGIIAAEKARILNKGGKIDAKLKALNERYSGNNALKGAFDWTAARKEIEALVK